MIRMRAVYLFLGLVMAFLLGAYVEHTFAAPFGYLDESWFATRSAPSLPNASTAIPRYSNARGAEDAPRDDVAAGGKTDFQRCVNTMVMRREPETEARTVCQKIISGIGG
jgi:hypothetical protein